jgi:hypothetical protein
MSSSIHIQKASGGSVHHNSRENFSHSVVFTDEKNEVWNNAKDSFTIYRDELKIRSEAYSNSTGQKLQSRAVTQLSAVLNLEQHHTLKDLEPIKKYLEKEFDTKVYQMAIHRDEGKLKEKATGNYLVSGTDFFLNPKDNNLYYDKKYTKPLNLENYTIEKNYHAHIEMMGLKSNGKAIRQDMNKFKLSKLQDFVAESLQMERGKNYRIEKSSKRLDTHEFKKAKKIENNVIRSAKEHIKTVKKETVTLAKAKELQAEIKQLREELKENKATRSDYAALEKTNKELKAEIKNKTLTVDQLQQTIQELKEDLNHKNGLVQSAITHTHKIENELDTLKKQNKSLQEQKSVLPSKDTNLSEKNDSRPNMNYLTASKELEIEFKNSFEEKEIKTGMFSSEKIKVLKPVKDKEESLYSRIKSKFTDMYEYMKKQYDVLKEQYQELTLKYNNLVKEHRSVKLENAELKAKVKELQLNTTLSHTGEKQLNKLVDDYEKAKPSAMEQLRAMQKKEISNESIKAKSEEVREFIRQNSSSGPTLDR